MPTPGRSAAILITGGAGYIGSHTAALLRRIGRKVITLDLKPQADVKGNVGDSDLLDRVLAEHNVGGIIHCAASTSVPESIERPLKYYRNNFIKTQELVEAAIHAKVKHLVFSSSAAVYDDTGAVRPANPYGHSKLMCETMLKDVKDIKSVSLRYSNVAGGLRTTRGAGFVKMAAEAAAGTREKLTVFGNTLPTRDGTALRDYVHIEDVAAANVMALQYLWEDGETCSLNCSLGVAYTVKEVIDTMSFISGRKIQVEYAPARDGEVVGGALDNTEAGVRLGWRPLYEDLKIIATSVYLNEINNSKP